MVLPLLFLLTASTAVPFAEPITATPIQDGINIGQLITWFLSLIAILGTAWGIFYNKKAKTPADELARADFAYTKIKERLDEVAKDREYLSNTNEALRLALTRADNDATATMGEKRELRKLIDQGDVRIAELLATNRELNERLDSIAEKVRRGQPITLGDVYGKISIVAEDDDETIADLEITRIPDRREANG